MTMFSVLFSNVYVGLVVVAFFGVTIFIHELGHYLVARWCGLKVEVFAIGFGPAIWKKKVNGIVYKIGCIPFGGYVALPQLDPTAMQTVQGAQADTAASDGTSGDDAEDRDEVLPPAAPWKKILVSLAGATGNVLLAILIAWLVYWIGMPATTANQDTLLGYVDPDSTLYTQGVRIGDRVVKVNGVKVNQWSHFIQEAAMCEAVELEVVNAAGDTLKVNAPTADWRYGIRMVSGVDACAPVTVGLVDSGMSAADAGVVSGDVIMTFDGQKVLSRDHLVDLVDTARDRTVPMTVLRVIDGCERELSLNVTPAYDAKNKMTRIGIQFRMPTQNLDVSAKIHPLPMTQIKHHASLIVGFLRNLVTPKKAARAANMVGGPVAIITSYVDMIRASFMLAVWFTGFLNINLAIINLLPLPVLDGGHVVFSLWEWAFRKPIHARIINIMVNAFAILLIGVFLLLSFRDVERLPAVGRLIKHFKDRRQATEDVAIPSDGAVAEPGAATEGPGGE